MRAVRVGARPFTDGGTQSGGLVRRWQGVAAVLAVATLIGCAGLHTPPAQGSQAEFGRRMGAGHRLYTEAEYALAGRRFAEAAEYAHEHRQTDAEKRATIAECVSWLRARVLAEFDDCSLRLDALHQRANHSEHGVGTLLALGAIAGDRPPPPFRIPEDVSPLLRKAAREGEE